MQAVVKHVLLHSMPRVESSIMTFDGLNRRNSFTNIVRTRQVEKWTRSKIPQAGPRGFLLSAGSWQLADWRLAADSEITWKVCQGFGKVRGRHTVLG